MQKFIDVTIKPVLIIGGLGTAAAGLDAFFPRFAVENVQKMDKRSFVRTPNKQMTSGYYVNIIFSAPPAAPAELRGRFTLNEYVYRVMFTLASETQATAEPAA